MVTAAGAKKPDDEWIVEVDIDHSNQTYTVRSIFTLDRRLAQDAFVVVAAADEIGAFSSARSILARLNITPAT